MSALHEARAQGLPVDIGVLAPFFWRWYRTHRDDTIVKRKILFFSVTIHVRDLNALFVALFGPDPLPPE